MELFRHNCADARVINKLVFTTAITEDLENIVEALSSAIINKASSSRLLQDTPRRTCINGDLTKILSKRASKVQQTALDYAVSEGINPESAPTQASTKRFQLGPQEKVAEYNRRVRVQRELLQKSVQVLYERINQKLQKDYQYKSTNEKSALNAKTDEKFVAYIMVVGADPARFQEMINRLEAAYSVGL
jgi:hypothetical protein